MEEDIIEDQDNPETEYVEQIKKLKNKLKKCETEKQEYLTGWQRERADIANARVQLGEDRKNLTKFAVEQFVSKLLPVLDSFDMAFSNKEAWESAPSEWRSGIEQIYSQMLSVLEAQGIVQYNPVDEVFDPLEHASFASERTDDPDMDNKVVEVIQKGYKIHDKVLRPAGVKIREFIK